MNTFVRTFTLLMLLLLPACKSTTTSVEDGGIDGATHADGDASVVEDASSDATIDADTHARTTTIHVHYPAGSHTISIRGSAGPLNWSSGLAFVSGANDTWTFTTTEVTGDAEWKPLLDDATWSRGPNYHVRAGTTVDVYPHFTTVNGAYSRAFDFASTTLNNSRGIWIYEPPTYLENSTAHFPVVYMHDGQNLFDPSAAFGGNTWQVADAMDTGAEDGTIAEAIVVGIENNSDRISEYTPVADPTDGGGNGDAYLRMIINELKPRIDHDYRTISDRGHTTMIGSSLGGLITAYAGVVHGDVFGNVGVMSPSTWWDNNWLLGEVPMTPTAHGMRPDCVYVDSGDSGTSNDDVTQTAMLADAYRALGYQNGVTFDYVVQAGGQHSEVYWAMRLPGTFRFLLGPRGQ